MRRLLEMRWEDALFAHWAVDPAVVEARLPEPLSAATYDGDAYLGVVPFVMADIRPRGLPVGRSFPELNLRTYVTDGDAKGVYFFTLDAADRLGVGLARRLFRLPYHRASMDVSRTGTGGERRVAFTSRRVGRDVPPAHFDATYGPDGAVSTPDPGSLEAFLVENYRFYTAGGDRLYYGDIDHEPWPLASGHLSVRANTLFDACGFDRPAGEPLVHYAPGIDVTAGRLRRYDVGDATDERSGTGVGGDREAERELEVDADSGIEGDTTAD